ncbi:MAG TPA: hypothetical protein VI322_04410, partial [Candidatus Saccharimonadia bacterium]
CPHRAREFRIDHSSFAVSPDTAYPVRPILNHPNHRCEKTRFVLGWLYLRVGAWTSNHPAVAFYEKHGFAVIETVLERPIGGWHDKI